MSAAVFALETLWTPAKPSDARARSRAENAVELGLLPTVARLIAADIADMVDGGQEVRRALGTLAGHGPGLQQAVSSSGVFASGVELP